MSKIYVLRYAKYGDSIARTLGAFASREMALEVGKDLERGRCDIDEIVAYETAVEFHRADGLGRLSDAQKRALCLTHLEEDGRFRPATETKSTSSELPWGGNGFTGWPKPEDAGYAKSEEVKEETK